MTVLSFFAFHGSSLDKLLKFLCLICWLGGGGVYIYCWYQSVMTSLVFPLNAHILIAVWLQNGALRFFALWVPMAFLLIHWRMTHIAVPAVYLGGCAVSIAFNMIALGLVMKYRYDGNLREEYTYLTQKEYEDGDEFPLSVKKMLTLHECCSWYGPTDFSPDNLFDIKSKINDDLDFMKDVAACYGDTFKVSKNAQNKVQYTNINQRNPKIPTGCSDILYEKASTTSKIIFIKAIVIAGVTLIVGIVYVAAYIQLRKKLAKIERTKSTRINAKEEETELIPNQPTDSSSSVETKE